MPIKCQCGQENPDSALHCENCGERLGLPQEDYNPYQQTQDAVPQNNYQQEAYTQPQQPYYYQPPVNQGEQPVSIATWVGMLLLFSIPAVNIVALIVVICVSQSKSLKNYAIAQFIIMGAAFLLSMLLFVGLGAAMYEFIEAMAESGGY